MTTANGFEYGNGAPSRSAPQQAAALSAADAVSYLEQYSRGDGLAVHELMDSRKNGGLTYNDFLMLPGKITFPAHEVSLQTRYVGHHEWVDERCGCLWCWVHCGYRRRRGGRGRRLEQAGRSWKAGQTCVAEVDI